MGSEMCIRDRCRHGRKRRVTTARARRAIENAWAPGHLWVDLGGKVTKREGRDYPGARDPRNHSWVKVRQVSANTAQRSDVLGECGSSTRFSTTVTKLFGTLALFSPGATGRHERIHSPRTSSPGRLPGAGRHPCGTRGQLWPAGGTRRPRSRSALGGLGAGSPAGWQHPALAPGDRRGWPTEPDPRQPLWPGATRAFAGRRRAAARRPGGHASVSLESS